MNYQQTLDYLYANLPMFQRVGAAAYKADLTNTIAICKHLKNPEKKFKSIHIAGTNGKGSVSHLLASILQTAGYRVGLYTSIGEIKIEQRYRAEFRFTSNGNRNRYRYRLGLSYPFGSETNEFKPFQVSASNEVFFTDKEPFFERNRLLFAFNYKPSRRTTLQIGYLHQFDYKINDETGKDFLQVGYYFELFNSR